MSDFCLASQEELTFLSSGSLSSMYKLSPFVWRDAVRYNLLLRVVNHSDTPSEKVARIHYGSSTDGLVFTLDEKAVLQPGLDMSNSYDSGGCEDPTVAWLGGTYYVYYSGWNQHLGRGELLLAAGSEIRHLQKRGLALQSSAQITNPKEATIVRAADGSWRLFFEFARDNQSCIGLARSANVAGPWEILESPFEARPAGWDSWHLSTGPIATSDLERPVMFYNGATQDAHWRIGWVVFDADYSRVIARSADALVVPDRARHADDTDIAFAASAVELDGNILLYYSVADQYCIRAVIQRA